MEEKLKQLIEILKADNVKLDSEIFVLQNEIQLIKDNLDIEFTKLRISTKQAFYNNNLDTIARYKEILKES